MEHLRWLLQNFVKQVELVPNNPFLTNDPLKHQETFDFLRFSRDVNENIALHKKRSFPLRISSVNVTKSAGKCGFGHIY